MKAVTAWVNLIKYLTQLQQTKALTVKQTSKLLGLAIKYREGK
jgi:hypothetical protein